MLTFFRACTVFASCVAAIALFGALMFSNSAVQEAGIAAAAIGIAVIPYIFTRMIEALEAAEAARKSRQANPPG